MITLVDKQAAKGAGWMTLATAVTLGAGIVALSTGIPMIVSGLFFVMAMACGFVTVSLSLVALHGRGEPVPAASVDLDSSSADSASVVDPEAEAEQAETEQAEPEQPETEQAEAESRPVEESASADELPVDAG
jgi:hypothetical protein